MGTQNSRARLKKIQQTLDPTNLAKVGYPVFVKNTPIDTGNARRHTTLKGASIAANYPYAKRLDNGYSQQSPDGMVKPTIRAILAYIKSKLGK